MEYRELGRTGLKVSALGFGGAGIGFVREDQSTVDSLLRSAIDAGLNVVDTAAAYWTSEALIGNAVKGLRKDVVLMSKCGAYDGFERKDWSKQGILDHITQSLKLLQTDYLDVAQLHSCDSEVLLRGEVIEGLIMARERGYTRFAGYSGDAGDAVCALGLDFFDTLQTSISVADQEAIELTLPAAIEKGVGVIAKRPIANAVWRNETKPEDAYHHEYWDRIQELGFDFLSLPLPESIGKALRFTLSLEGVSTAIVGTTRPERWQQNAVHVFRGPLDPGEFEAIRDRWRSVADESWIGQI